MNENSKEYIELKKYFQERNKVQPLDLEPFLKTKKLEDADDRTKQTSYSAYLFLYYHQYNKRIKHMVEEEIENGFPNTKSILEKKKPAKKKKLVNKKKTMKEWIKPIFSFKEKKTTKPSKKEKIVEQIKEKINRKDERKKEREQEKKSRVKMPLAYKIVAAGLGILACISTYRWGYALDIANPQASNLTPLLTTIFFALSGAATLTLGSIHQCIKQVRTDNMERLKEEIEEEEKQEKEQKKDKRQERAPLFVSKELSDSAPSFEETKIEDAESKENTYHLKKDEKTPISVEFDRKESSKREDSDLSINVEKVTKDILKEREREEKIEEVLENEKQESPVTKGLRLS